MAREMKDTKRTIVVISIIAAFALALLISFFVITGLWRVFDRPEITTDISKYGELRSGPSANEMYRDRLGMDESIWPEKITEVMDVQDYKMVYYNPWDAQYLGYLVVKYPDSEYESEVERLRSYKSTEYKGYYGVTGKEDNELLAINADPHYGFIYAMADKDNTIVYAEQLFCNGFMDLRYEKYVPKEYFLDGFDATEHNPYGRKLIEEMPDVYNLQGNPAE